ncbi:MAG: UDP-N-acetyl-D-glucosamine dehydrogenase [Herpetosiphonaceae bacterium]|nr:MAG: UDP-N-acetyl-D-glucosamine dehydrogenase [Herpetosiphonaceae bacterium]
MTTAENLKEKIESRKSQLGVIGLGYVGLPLAVRAAAVGFPVLGFDVSLERVAAIQSGESYIGDVPTEALKPLVQSGALNATTDFTRLAECDVIVICVPTPLNVTRDPDMKYIRIASEDITRTLRSGQLIVLESTTYPGTTEELVLQRLAASGLAVGEDFFLAFSPERIDPGQVSSKGWTVENTPKIVGGVTMRCTDLAVAFYSHITSQVVPVSSPRVAELAKLFENIFRVVNIALVNELTLLCDQMNLNVWEVIDAAATKPFGFMKFTPGPGVGGHCIPIDPFYLSWKAREYGLSTRFIELAGEINLHMPSYVRELVIRALNAGRKSLNGSLIVLLGVAYKKDVADYRESPAFRIIDLLEHDGARVVCCDPYVDEFQSHDGRMFQTVPLSDDLLSSADCVVIITDHSVFDYKQIVEKSPVVVDTRNATRDVQQGREKIVLL